MDQHAEATVGETAGEVAVDNTASAYSQTGDAGPITNAPDADLLVNTLRGLLSLTRRALPEATYTHLMNAGREAVLAFTSLFEGLSDTVNNSRDRSSGANKVRRHIDVE